MKAQRLAEKNRSPRRHREKEEKARRENIVQWLAKALRRKREQITTEAREKEEKARR
jgi:hypothetical protein